MRKSLIAATVAALAFGGLTAPSFAVEGTPASDAGIVPTYVAGNPTCSDLRPDLTELKVNTGDGGTASDAYATVSYTTPDGKEVNWTSTKGIDLVVVKGGPNANSYVYDPPAELTSDGGLYSPINPSNGQPYGISHVSFCYDVNVEVSKTAATTFTRTFDWDISKAALNDLDLFRGDSGDIDWEVAVTKDEGTDSDWAVTGTISILNPHPTASATVTGVTDVISGDIEATVDCPADLVIPAGGTLECDYSSPLPDGTDRVNTATVTTTGVVLGGEGTADVLFGDPTTVEGNEISVTDDLFGDLGSTTESKTWSYSITRACGAEDGDGYEVPNTATASNGKSASATAQVNCYDLTVTKDAFTSYTRTYDWSVFKQADQTALTLAEGQTFNVNYEVAVSGEFVDSDFKVFSDEGIKVANSSPVDVDLTGVADVFNGTALAVDCGVTFPYTLPAGETLTCSYEGPVGDATGGTNTATATTEFGFDYEGTAAVDFGGAVVTEVDECITLSDVFEGVAVFEDEVICAGDLATIAPKTYATPFVGETCGPRNYNNFARIVTNDTGTVDEADWDVLVTVPCDFGCTLTQGYWKTHSDQGPAPYDDGWGQIGELEESTPFFLSGKTWLETFRTPPAGNAYYNLAHQYMAAKLNLLNGASSTPAVDAAILAAEAIFNAQGVNDVTLTRAERTAALAAASTLDKYNNGLIGPGHCSEQPA